ncbi:hypothetical protein MXB_3781, partial [Myxobolus squamalis]
MNRPVKYGIISRKKLIQDLQDWNYLYVAGRLHKPVIWLSQSLNNLDLTVGIDKNFENAIRTALLLLPEEFSEQKLYEEICNISYNGDIRTWFKLDLTKSTNIVATNFERFQQMYNPFFKKFSHSLFYKNGMFQQDKSPSEIIKSFQKLPSAIRVFSDQIIKMKTSVNIWPTSDKEIIAKS